MYRPLKKDTNLDTEDGKNNKKWACYKNCVSDRLQRGQKRRDNKLQSRRIIDRT